MLFTHSFHNLFNFSFQKLLIDAEPNSMTIFNSAVKTLLHAKIIILEDLMPLCMKT